MSKRTYFIAAFFLFLLGCSHQKNISVLKSSQIPGDTTVLVDQLLQKTGLNKEIDDFREAFTEIAIQQIPGDKTRNYPIMELLQTKISEANESYDHAGKGHEFFSKRFSREELTYLLAWFDSESGKKITAAEMEDDPDGMKEYLSDLKNLQLPPQRIELISKLERSVNYTESYYRLKENVALSMADCLDHVIEQDGKN